MHIKTLLKCWQLSIPLNDFHKFENLIGERYKFMLMRPNLIRTNYTEERIRLHTPFPLLPNAGFRLKILEVFYNCNARNQQI